MDYENIKTYDDCLTAVTAGTLAKVLLMPARFGGPDEKHNQTFIPPAHAELVNQANEMVAKLLKDKQAGEEIDYKVTPNYKGDSYVPNTITVYAKLSISGGAIKQTIEIW